MKTKRYIFVTNEDKEVVRFCGLAQRKLRFRRKGTLPYLFFHHHLVKEVWLPENATAVHAGVFTDLTALEDIYIPNHITLFEGCLPDHKVTIHLPLMHLAAKSCRRMIGTLIIRLEPVWLPSSGMCSTERHGCT